MIRYKTATKSGAIKLYSAHAGTSEEYKIVLANAKNYLDSKGYKTPLEAAKIISEYVDRRVYGNYKSGQSDLENLLETGNGNCLALTHLKYRLYKDLLKKYSDLKVNVVTPKGHIAILLEYKGKEHFVENTIKNGFCIRFKDKYVAHRGKDAENAIIAAEINNQASKLVEAGTEDAMKDAMEMYKMALNCNPNMPDIWKNLIGISKILGEDQKTIDSYIKKLRAIEYEMQEEENANESLDNVLKEESNEFAEKFEPIFILPPDLKEPKKYYYDDKEKQTLLDKGKKIRKGINY